MTDNYFLNELRHGVAPETLSQLLADAIAEYELEKEAKLIPLADAVVAYIGADHPIFNDISALDIAEEVSGVLENLLLGYDVVSNTEQKCSCGDDCSCKKEIEANPPQDKKIVGKITTFEDGVKKTKDLTEDDVDNIFSAWLKTIR